jgi:hypothetical protein
VFTLKTKAYQLANQLHHSKKPFPRQSPNHQWQMTYYGQNQQLHQLYQQQVIQLPPSYLQNPLRPSYRQAIQFPAPHPQNYLAAPPHPDNNGEYPPLIHQ